MKALRETLQADGYSVTATVSVHHALELLRGDQFDVVLTDLMMPEMDGIAFLSKVLEIDSSIAGIVMTGHGTIDTAVSAMRTGAVDFVLKPFKLSDIRRVLERSLALRRLRMENIQLREAIAISELSVAVSSIRNPDQVLQKAVESAFLLSNCGQVFILIPQNDIAELRIAAAFGSESEQCLARQFVTAESLSDWTTRVSQTLTSLDACTDVETQFSPPFSWSSGTIAVPMISGGALVGILAVATGVRGRTTSTGRVRALSILANSAAAAYESALLFEKLRIAEQRYRLLAENAPDVIYRYEVFPQRGYSFISAQVSAVCGYSSNEYYSNPDLGLKIVHPENRPVLESILRGESTNERSVTMRWSHKNGSLIWIEQQHSLIYDSNGRLIAVECIARDVTERRRLEEQLRQSQKMEAIGRLAGGIAHDFNNLLTVINGYSSQIIDRLQPSDPLCEEIGEISHAGERAASLTRQLLAFSRQQVVTTKAVNLNTIITDIDRMLRRMITENIEICTVLEPNLDAVLADRGQIEQIVINLAINARDAMPNGGRLTIETANVELDASYIANHSGVTPGHYVLLAVSDTGIGMNSATQAQIFEPFFTTKSEGHGTGLGLSTVHGIVKQTGGDIWVYSEIGHGTSFKIYLPRTSEQTTSAGNRNDRISNTGSETILVVEDEEGVRRLLCAVLSRAGYTVLAASTPLEAIRLCENHNGVIHLTITDMVMPGLAGPEVVERLASIRPGIKALFMSGYTNHAALRNGILNPQMSFLQKPFTAPALTAKVREILDSVRDEAAK